jgi:hypothetical protein
VYPRDFTWGVLANSKRKKRRLICNARKRGKRIGKGPLFTKLCVWELLEQGHVWHACLSIFLEAGLCEYARHDLWRGRLINDSAWGSIRN